MRRRVLLILLAAGIIAAAVHGWRMVSWWAWHGDQQAIDRAVDQAINAPGGGDYARAADVIRASSRPDPVKRFQVGELVVGAYVYRSPRPPPETLEAGVRMMEDFAVTDDPDAGSGVRTLRILFENGGRGGTRRFPTDAPTAACWRAVEQHRSTDPARCVALRRQRLPMPAAR